MPDEEYTFLEDLIAYASLEKGKVIHVDEGYIAHQKEHVHYAVYNIRKAWTKINDLYKNPQSTREDFVKAIDNSFKEMHDNISDAMDRVEADDNLFIVDSKDVRKDGSIKVTLKKVDTGKKIELVRSIAKKLLKQLTDEQILKMLEDGIKHNNDVPRLEKINKKLDKEKPKIEGKGGCYKLVVDGMDVVVFR